MIVYDLGYLVSIKYFLRLLTTYQHVLCFLDVAFVYFANILVWNVHELQKGHHTHEFIYTCLQFQHFQHLHDDRVWFRVPCIH